jgi:hypothetical protein
VELDDAPALCGATNRQARRASKIRYAIGARFAIIAVVSQAILNFSEIPPMEVF